ncbi:Dipeptide-binding ABC transporter, periplasmic substrate-binding component [Pseudonocardia sp. Ae168_Ps1]|uniref:ABC transporter substrate-binding protein n=1 Tax=unclassified Pseudonocardia TaxID=2619320 RepID=UPI0006CB11A2|nr:MULTISPECIES: ABC transporter substrate-binding protein [unclassified Pseudonocardia]ALE72751.1 ABC transporter substrate-binding protein [Pseudonocardia sp. EC080625-04]ALL76070.1 ABC transporter substrate-binding protein [Pseudonocardia sp. EC080610-09]ALL83097.1 ABC transporter substrate-binding protein [Pseudonocardia sp. EC080619-01]OLL73202.1 Dipeptide-binding ABC transporter, periplasmic substrate-binding component [Pseudonocardia sp. Ae150A_Ps1]OLL79179.1 Dipeptide-binding ABC trans
MTLDRQAGPRLDRRAFLRWTALAVAGTAAVPLAGCAGPTGAPGPGTIVLGLNRSLASLDNKLNQFDGAVTVQRAVRQALTRVGPGQTAQPVLADRFERTGPTEWTVRLRDGVRYSDGSPVTVTDVDVALRCYGEVNGGFIASLFPEIPTVRPVDDRTFRLVTSDPVPVMDLLMANVLVTPAAANRPEQLTDGIGSGPFRVAEANTGTGDYTLVRNENYWGAAAHLESVQVRFVPEESSRVVAMRSGELDVIDSITPDSAEQLAGLPSVILDRSPSTRTNQLFYNFRKPPGHPLADPRVREALTYAVDGEALARDVLVGSVQPARGVVASALSGAADTGGYRYDPARCRQMLDAAGVRDLELTIIWESGEFPADTSVMESVAGMLGRVGVRTRLQQFQPGGDITAWRQGRGGDWDVLGNGFAGPTGEAATVLQGMYGGTPAKERTRDTYQGYVVPEVARTLDAAAAETDPARREAALAGAQKKIWDTWPCLWAFVPDVVQARRQRVSGIELLPTNSYDLSSVALGASA